MESLGRCWILAGILLMAAGIGFFRAGRLDLPLDRLLGDVRIEVGGGSPRIPVTTSIVLSLVLTLILNLVLRNWRR